jgi:hypothetical protein
LRFFFQRLVLFGRGSTVKRDRTLPVIHLLRRGACADNALWLRDAALHRFSLFISSRASLTIRPSYRQALLLVKRLFCLPARSFFSAEISRSYLTIVDLCLIPAVAALLLVEFALYSVGLTQVFFKLRLQYGE